MRTRQQLEEANKDLITKGEDRMEYRHAAPAQELILEVLLDCRDLLIQQNEPKDCKHEYTLTPLGKFCIKCARQY